MWTSEIVFSGALFVTSGLLPSSHSWLNVSLSLIWRWSLLDGLVRPEWTQARCPARFPQGHINIFPFLQVSESKGNGSLCTWKGTLDHEVQLRSWKVLPAQGDPVHPPSLWLWEETSSLKSPFPGSWEKSRFSRTWWNFAIGPVGFICKTFMYIYKLLSFAI